MRIKRKKNTQKRTNSTSKKRNQINKSFEKCSCSNCSTKKGAKRTKIYPCVSSKWAPAVNKRQKEVKDSAGSTINTKRSKWTVRRSIQKWAPATRSGNLDKYQRIYECENLHSNERRTGLSSIQLIFKGVNNQQKKTHLLTDIHKSLSVLRSLFFFLT